ncbi:diguanylate cyclase (GGDEF)-like protein [Dokdonella fugitiva]|uniref:diguanylate cyclase n=1 Tax=Dokdonella fugitiva TaxID=328517 RepID=A0A839EXG4_9GAMM|nr:diguanylate cyclase [Dokdonella fugitiva]MBA8886389.1 diguanylate cyclase (GGDEF)-like protein [Dokdonella fugitiva]
MNASNALLTTTLSLFAVAFLVLWRWRNMRPALFWGLGFACWAACYLFQPFAIAGRGLVPAMLSQSLFLSSIFLQMHGLQDRAGEARFALRMRLAIWVVSVVAICWLLVPPETKWLLYSIRLSMRVALTGFALYVMARHLEQLIDTIVLAFVALMTLCIGGLAALIIHAMWTSGGAPTPPDLNAVSQIAGNVIGISFGMILLAAAGTDIVHRYRVAAMRDALTDLPNRRQFDEYLRAQWATGDARRLPLSLLLVDVDLFKSYNDSYGHAGGDRCLVQIADALRASTRSGELCARLGGEEFAVLLPETTSAEALLVAERIRSAIESAGLPLAKSPYGRVTVSIGVATTIPAGDVDPALFESADEALYRAKNQGRNRVEANSIHWPDRAGP